VTYTELTNIGSSDRILRDSGESGCIIVGNLLDA
jgi:hypothetical protein